MIFAFPPALIGSIAIVGLVATYLYRSRFRKKPVSSLMLWRQTALPNEGGIRRDRLRLPWIFYLELAILAALVIAAAAPMLRRPRQHTLTVVVDDSASMTARGRDGRTPRERAVDALETAIRRNPPAAVRVLAADASGTAVAGIVPPARAAALLAGLPAASPSASLGPAIARAAELPGSGGEILVLTDQPPPPDFEVRPPVAWIALGDAAPNAAIVYADRSIAADGAEHLLLELRAFGDAPPANVRLTLAPLAVGGSPLLVQDVDFDDDGRARLALTLPPGTPDVLAVLPDDALAFDNRAILLAAAHSSLHIGLCIANDGLRHAVRRAVEASGRAASLREFAPGAWLPSPEPHLVFADASAALPPRRGWQVRFHAPAAPSLVKGPFLQDGASPLLEGVSFQGAVWNVGTNLLDGRALVFAGSTPLVALEESRRSATVHILAADAASTFFRTPAWPAFVWNLIDGCAAAQPGPSTRHARVGEPVVFALAADERAAVLDTPAGERTLRAVNGRANWMPPEPGLYALRTGGQTMPFAVNLFAESESDLRGCMRGRWGGGQEALHDERAFRPFAWLAGILALALLAFHHAALSRRESRARSQIGEVPKTGGGAR
jgi:hypothetical protein